MSCADEDQIREPNWRLQHSRSCKARPTDADLEARLEREGLQCDGMEHEVCSSCLSADAELEIHGTRMIMVCPCGNHGPIGYSPEEARAGWNEQNAHGIMWESRDVA